MSLPKKLGKERSDVIMLGMSGRDLAEAISILRPEIEILYMSGYPDDIIADHGILKPGINFLPKPFPAEGLSLKVREVLNKKKIINLLGLRAFFLFPLPPV